MRKGKRYTIIFAVVGFIAVILVILLIKTGTYSKNNIVAVSYNEYGGIFAKRERFTVFEEDGVYYYAEMMGNKKEVYTISKKEFNAFMSKTKQLHLEEIDGYDERTPMTDGMGWSFHIMYKDGTIITGDTYGFCSFPSEHDASLLQAYVKELKSKKACDYEFEVNNTYDTIFITCAVNGYGNYIRISRTKEGKYTVSIDLRPDFGNALCKDTGFEGEAIITESQYEKIREMALSTYNTMSEDESVYSGFDLYSDIYGQISKTGGEKEEEIQSLYNEIIDMILPEIKEIDQ